MIVRDEVCGMTIPADQATETVELDGKTYYFCSERCRRNFEDHPEWYVPRPDPKDGTNDADPDE